MPASFVACTGLPLLMAFEATKTACAPFVDTEFADDLGVTIVPLGPDRHAATVLAYHPERLLDANPPLLVIGGGFEPSSLPTGHYELAWIAMREARYARDLGERAVLFVSFPGGHAATPDLSCPAYQAAVLTLMHDPDGYEAPDQPVTCLAHLNEAGLTLGDLTPEELAAQLGEVRRALGVSRWDVHASSYGARLALEAARADPVSVRSIVLDSPDVFAGDYVTARQDAFERRLALWDQAGRAAGREGAESERLRALIEQADATPIILRDVMDNALFVHGEDVRSLVYGAFYAGGGDAYASAIMDVLEHVRMGAAPTEEARATYDAVLTTLFGWEEDDGASMLFGNVALCAVYELGDPARLRAPGALPFSAPDAHDDLDAICPDAAPADILAPLGDARAIPVLVLSGTQDPITPPAFGAVAASLFEDARHVVVEGAGHGVSWTSWPEAAEALLDFTQAVGRDTDDALTIPDAARRDPSTGPARARSSSSRAK